MFSSTEVVQATRMQRDLQLAEELLKDAFDCAHGPKFPSAGRKLKMLRHRVYLVLCDLEDTMYREMA